MDPLSTRFLPHCRVCIIGCCLCDRSWEEHFVGVELVTGFQPIGRLCPSCLDRQPQFVANQFRRIGQRYRHLASQLDRIIDRELELDSVDPDDRRYLNAHLAAAREAERAHRNLTDAVVLIGVVKYLRASLEKTLTSSRELVAE